MPGWSFYNEYISYDDYMKQLNGFTASRYDQDIWAEWIKESEAIFGTQPGIPDGYFYGPTSLSKDRQTLYLFLEYQPKGPVVIKGLKNAINRIRVVGNGTKLTSKVMMKQYWSQVPGLVYIDVPENALDDDVTVIAVLLDGPIDLYNEE